MAVTDQKHPPGLNTSKSSKRLKPKESALTALTAAALALPGLMPVNAIGAEEDSVDFQYSHYQEGKRDIWVPPGTGIGTAENIVKLPNKFLNNPIEADSLHGGARVMLTDRIKFAFNYTQDTWSGATPIGTAPAVVRGMGVKYVNDDALEGIIARASPWGVNIDSFSMAKNGDIYSSQGKKNNQLTQVMSYASPEIRKQGDFKLRYEWDEAAVDAGGGMSIENDYESRFASLGARQDFNQKRTSVNVGLSYTNSDTNATLDPDSNEFILDQGYEPQAGADPSHWYNPNTAGRLDVNSTSKEDTHSAITRVLRGNRQDWGSTLGMTQVLSKNALLEVGMAYTRSNGFLSNPYKAVYVFSSLPNTDQSPDQSLTFRGTARLEARPTERNQFNWNLGYNQYLEALDAGLHLDYHFGHDDWGIDAHTFEADWVQPVGAGWTVTPRIRYYSQSRADFYAPFFTEVQAINPVTTKHVNSAMNRSLPKHYSSDQRLSGFGALSGGLTIAKQFAKGVQLEAGFEYYSHAGNLALGDGEDGFADYDYFSANAALKVNLGALHFSGSGNDNLFSHAHHHNIQAPAGLLFAHTLAQAGDMMLGYRFMRSEQAGAILNGSKAVDLDTVRLHVCGDRQCSAAPKHMTMNMHMLDLMVAPTDWLTMMLMPQWMDMEMDMTHLAVTDDFTTSHNRSQGVNNHQTGGIGDTGLYALVKLFDQPGHHVVLSLGGTAPTGDVDIMERNNGRSTEYHVHYGMQLGSGTWDLKPSLTYTGEHAQWSWGAQATGTKRLEKRNAAHFAFGDIFQGSIWGGYQWSNWLSTTLRGMYTQQGSLRGEYLPVVLEIGNVLPYTSKKHIGPFDHPANYGGQFVDLGLGINVTIPNGAFAGNSLKFEWLQPLHSDYNGYQLDRDGALSFSWGYGF